MKAYGPWVVISMLLLLTIQMYTSINARHTQDKDSAVVDSAVKILIISLLDNKANAQQFHYPQSVKRIYKNAGFKPLWLAPELNVRNTSTAVNLLSCVLKFGLNQADYHAKELSLQTMQRNLDTSLKVTDSEKLWFDLLLTDALITLINDLHFGKLNPVYTPGRVDKGEINGFSAEQILMHAFEQEDFRAAILNVQPKIKAYVLLQAYLEAQIQNAIKDCNAAPTSIVRKMAVNMERLRWATIEGDTHIQINIPSYTLRLRRPDTTYLFRVIVGKPSNPTPQLESSITYFQTAPDWQVPARIFVNELLPKALKDADYLRRNHFAIYSRKGTYVALNRSSLLAVRRNPENYSLCQSSGSKNALGLLIFRFPNRFNVYLHDTPEKQLFSQDRRALSHGCIRVQYAEKLASIILSLDGQKQKNAILHSAISNYEPITFSLKKPIPILITYLTCEIADHVLIEYDDIYKRDRALEFALYGSQGENR